MACLARAIDSPVTGIFNVAGDGAMTIDEIAALAGQAACCGCPRGCCAAALAVLHPLGLTRYGPAQVDFLRYRPVLDNTRLKTVFGFTPRLTSRQVFEAWRASRKKRE